VEWPQATHEVPLTNLKEVMNPAVQQLPINKCILHATFKSNFTFQSSQTGFSATPDLSLIIMSLKRKMSRGQDFEVLAIVECAFSQNKSDLEEKIRNELAACPEIALVITILINESETYHRPTEESQAWRMFSQEEKCQDATSFLRFNESDISSKSKSEPKSDSSLKEDFTLQPIVIAGHQWCSISSVEYHVWVKSDMDEVINIDKVQVTCGVSDVFYIWWLPLMHYSCRLYIR